MVDRDLGRLLRPIFILVGAAMLMALPACAGATSTPTTVPQATVTPLPTATLAPTATPASTATPRTAITPIPTEENSSGDTVLAQGKLIYEETAGGVGCAFCHGFEAKGGGVAGEGAPDIRGVSKGMIRGALAGGVPLMTFIKLTEEELTAVSEYVKFLSK